MAVNNLGQNIQRVIDGLDLIRDELTIKTGEDQSNKTIEQLPAVINGIDSSTPFITNAATFFASVQYIGVNNVKTVLEMKDIIQKYWKVGEITTFYNCFAGNLNVTQEFIDWLIPYFQGSRNFSGCFANNNIIEEIVFPSLQNVSDNCFMSSIFYSCTSMKRIYFGNFYDKVTDIVGIFASCYNLEEIEFEDTSNCKNLSSIMFYNTGSNPALASINTKVINLNLSSVEQNYGSVFENLTNWGTLVYFPKQILNLKMIQNEIYGENLNIVPNSTHTSKKHVLNKLTIAQQPNGTITYGGILNLQNCSFERDGLIEFFNTLPTQLGTKPSRITITLTGNPGVATLTEEDKEIATNKGWILAL